LRRRVRGDLDWITLKAMAKEPARRYASAEALASDIAHYLADEPVAAGPPGVRYRARKFVRRHRHALTMAAIAVAALIIGAFASRLNPARAARSPSSQPLAAAAPTPTSTPAAVQPGLSAEIFSGHFEKPVTRRVDRSIQFTWPRGVPPEQGVTVPRFAIKWTGAIVIPPGGVKAIGVEADDGARLYLDGNLLCEFHTPGRHFSANPVQAGTHTIEVDYWNRVAQGHVALLWVPSGKVAQVVPEQFLFQRAAK
jgi:hypothetical protein